MKSGSLSFPFREDVLTGGLKRATTINDVLLSAIKSYLLTSPGQRRGNPIGSFVPSLRHQLLPQASLRTLSKELKTDLTKQFPGVQFVDVTMVKTLSEDATSDLLITIQFGTSMSELTELAILI